MDQQEMNQFARNIVKSNCYLTLGTSDGDPWVAPVYYCIDDHYTFYFASQLNSVHTTHLLKNSNVALAIFDSHQKEGTGNGVQVKGKAYLLKDDEIDEALNWFHTTFIKLKKESYMSPAPYRLFRIVPENFYILDPDEKHIDKRIEVVL